MFMAKTTRKSASQPAEAGAAETPAGDEAAPRAAPLGRGEFMDRVATACGSSKSDVKPIVQAVLAELGKALAAGQDMNLLPLGKLKITRENPIEGGRMFVVRVRQPSEAPAAAKDDDEDA